MGAPVSSIYFSTIEVDAPSELSGTSAGVSTSTTLATRRGDLRIVCFGGENPLMPDAAMRKKAVVVVADLKLKVIAMLFLFCFTVC